jgi:rare lipoprotein A (peptidoglycan hydrolase)
MPNIRLARPGSAFALVLGGTAALIGCQQIVSEGPANATPAGVDVDPPRNVEFQPVAAGPMSMSAAEPTGEFEEPFVKPTPPATPATTRVPTPAPEPPKAYESGIASTYGERDSFEGNRTACGRIFHTRTVQVAHKSLPCGTKVRVEDTATGRSVVAEVTDRGPYVVGRIVDLSWAALSQLEPTSPGLVHVNIYVVNDQN